MSRAFYDDVADALVGFLPIALRGFERRVTSWNCKIWFPPEAREHYEVQRIRRAGLEIGFHAEHPDAARNDEVLTRLGERAWRRALGSEPEAGAFLGRPSPWRRVSEIWNGEGLDSPEAAIEAAERLASYIRAIEPLRAPRPGRTQPKRTARAK